MPKKLSYEFIKNYIEEEGYILLSDNFENNRTKLKLQCPKGHIWYVNFSNFKEGKRCRYCYYIEKGQKQRYTYEYVKSFIENEGYALLSDKYVDGKSKLKIKCKEGHIFGMPFNSFKMGHRCSECFYKERSIVQRLDHETVRDQVEKYGYKLLSKKYKNSHRKIKLMCPKGHIIFMSYNSFKQGNRCNLCNNSRKLQNKEIIELLKPYEYIRENKDRKIEVKCRYCNKGFIPERRHLTGRIRFINGITDQEHGFYCSNECKENCPIFGQKIGPKGYKPATSREVESQLRQLVFQRDNYTCQKCNTYKDDLDVGIHCHHIWPINEDPHGSADKVNCITLCEYCHKEAHQKPGCEYNELKCSEQMYGF